MTVLTRRSLLAATALAAARPLPGASSQARKEALLAWALEDAALEDSAGHTDTAAAIRADVKAAGAAKIGDPVLPTANLFPAIPNPAHNPYLADALRRVGTFRDSPVRYPKGPVGNIVHTDAEGWRFINICTQALELTFALCHPESPLAGDPRLIAPMLRRFTTVYEYLVPAAKNLADFGISPWLSEMYFLLRSTYPTLILPTYKASWERAIQTNADAIAAKYGQVFLEGREGTAYPNAHTHYINALLFSSLILKRPDYREMAEGGIKLMSTCLYPDGGYAYIGYQNECYTYHGIAVKDMLRYSQVTGNKLAYEQAVRTRWYYPLSIEPPGVAEYSTAPSWKPYWNMATGSDGVAVVAALTKCPHNTRIVRENPPDATFWLASLYRDDVTAAPAPDNYLTYDRNIEGPRGRFGAWSFSGTSRDYRDDARGKLTYVGAIAMGANQTPKWPVSGALHAAGAEVRVKPGATEGNRWATHLCLARQERNASSSGKDFAAVTTTHRLSLYGGPATDWAVTQQWLFTPQRLVGFVSLEALADMKAFSMGGAIQLVSGRANWGIKKTVEQVDPKTFRYGALFIRFHALAGNTIRTEYTDVFSGNSSKSGRIVLEDRTGAGMQNYARGTRTEFLVEIHPDWVPPAESVMALPRRGGLVGFQAREGQRQFQLVHNTSDALQDFANPRAAANVSRSGEQYRAPWLETTVARGPKAAAATESVFPHGHLVFIQAI